MFGQCEFKQLNFRGGHANTHHHQRSKSCTNLGYHRKIRFMADFFFHLLCVCIGESWACATVCIGKSEDNSGFFPITWVWEAELGLDKLLCLMDHFIAPPFIFVCFSLWKQVLKYSSLTLIEDEYTEFIMIFQEVIHLQESRSWAWWGASILSRLWSLSQENPEL